MWIMLSIIGAVILLVTAILLMPIHLVISKGKENSFTFACRILFFSFGTDKKENKTFNLFKKKVGADSEKTKRKANEKKDIIALVKENLGLLKEILKECVKLFGHIKGERFMLDIAVCGDDAALCAIHYGECCAIAYPVIGFINSIIKVKDKQRKIEIHCDYENGKSAVSFDFRFSVRVCRILAAALRVLKNKIKIK